MAAAVVLACGGAASSGSAGRSANPPLTKREAARATHYLQSAIELEHEAAHVIGSEPAVARLKLSVSALSLAAAFDLLEKTSAEAATSSVGNAAASDTRAMDLLESSPTSKKARREALADIKLAIKQKHAAIEHIAAALASSPPAPPPAPAPAPTVGPLGTCVFVTNNGGTSTENVKVNDPGGAGLSGSVLFNGQGLNMTDQITLDPNGGAVSPFTVGVFGTSSITITVTGGDGRLQTLTIPFTLDQSNDVTTGDCATHQ